MFVDWLVVGTLALGPMLGMHARTAKPDSSELSLVCV